MNYFLFQVKSNNFQFIHFHSNYSINLQFELFPVLEIRTISYSCKFELFPNTNIVEQFPNLVKSNYFLFLQVEPFPKLVFQSNNFQFIYFHSNYFPKQQFEIFPILEIRTISALPISKCFRKAGILSDEMDVVTVGYDDDSEDPFLECDVRREIQTLIERSMAVDDRCTLEQYLQGYCNLPVFIDQYNENWDVNFMEEHGIDQQDEGNDSDVSDRVSDTEVVGIDVEQPRSMVTNFKEALLALEDVYTFLQTQKGNIQAINSVGSAIDSVANLKIQYSVQTNLHNYFWSSSSFPL